MNRQEEKLYIIKFAYWLGIGADTLWAVALFTPRLFGILIGRPDFEPDLQTRSIMWIGGSLMIGWTFLLLWAIRKPVERRVVILLTAIPVVLGMFITSIVDYLNGNALMLWILINCIVLLIAMIASYMLYYWIANENRILIK